MSRRIRSLKPEITEDEKVAPLSDTAFRLFTSMITLADDHGNVRADVRWLQAQIWWAHQSPPNVLLALVELYRATLIEVYAVRGGTYAHLKGWEKHQRIDNAGKGKVPSPKDADAQEVSFSEAADNPVETCEPRRLAATRGEPPLDLDLDLERDRKGEGEDLGVRAPARAKAKRRLPADWSPRSEEKTKAVESGIDCDREAEAFRDHHSAKGSTMVDWDAAFRTWLRNAVRFRHQGPQRAPGVGRVEPRNPEQYPSGEVKL